MSDSNQNCKCSKCQTNHNKHWKRRILVINSEDRGDFTSNGVDSTSSNFYIDLSRSAACKSIRRLKLIYAAIPNSIYTVRTGINDTIIFSYSSQQYTATIAPGFYTQTTLPPAVVTALNNAHNNTFTCSISSTTGLVTIGGQNFFTLLPNLWNLSTVLLGFPANVAPGQTIFATGTAIANLAVPNLINVSIVNKPELIRSSNQQQQFQFVVPLDVVTGTYAYFRENQYFHQNLDWDNGDQTFTEAMIQLLFTTGEQVNLNGLDWTMILELEYALN